MSIRKIKYLDEQFLHSSGYIAKSSISTYWTSNKNDHSLQRGLQLNYTEDTSLTEVFLLFAVISLHAICLRTWHFIVISCLNPFLSLCPRPKTTYLPCKIHCNYKPPCSRYWGWAHELLSFWTVLDLKQCRTINTQKTNPNLDYDCWFCFVFNSSVYGHIHTCLSSWIIRQHYKFHISKTNLSSGIFSSLSTNRQYSDSQKTVCIFVHV